MSILNVLSKDKGLQERISHATIGMPCKKKLSETLRSRQSKRHLEEVKTLDEPLKPKPAFLSRSSDYSAIRKPVCLICKRPSDSVSSSDDGNDDLSPQHPEDDGSSKIQDIYDSTDQDYVVSDSGEEGKFNDEDQEGEDGDNDECPLKRQRLDNKCTMAHCGTHCTLVDNNPDAPVDDANELQAERRWHKMSQKEKVNGKKP